MIVWCSDRGGFAWGWRSQVRVGRVFTWKNERIDDRTGGWLAGGVPPIKKIFSYFLGLFLTHPWFWLEIHFEVRVVRWGHDSHLEMISRCGRFTCSYKLKSLFLGAGLAPAPKNVNPPAFTNIFYSSDTESTRTSPTVKPPQASKGSTMGSTGRWLQEGKVDNTAIICPSPQ
jgi:hypothetical protein